ncbi:hypothetical protein R1flu_023123 [Riccia fluitans]|uniref:BTB domain-containing protein n=1 Tax=Riccia fluitans TaxID=41844 RepID=A0ABD1XU40_9MARC
MSTSNSLSQASTTVFTCPHCKDNGRSCLPITSITRLLLPQKRLHFLLEYEPSPLSNDFRGDVEFIGRDEIPVYAHRFILAGRSAVFRKMLDTDMKEKKSGTIRVYDATEPVLLSMVNFCYTARIQFTEEAPAVEVWKIAEKYDIQELKEVCEDELARSISRDNLVERVTLAWQYDDKNLNRMTKEFFRNIFDEAYVTFVSEILQMIN